MIDRIKTTDDKLAPGEVPDNEDHEATDTQTPAEATKANYDARLKNEQDKLAAQKEAFALDQKSRAAAFEREQNAKEIALTRNHEQRMGAAEFNAKIAQEQAELDDRAFADGLLTHEDLLHKQHLLAPHNDCVLPWQATAEGEPTVVMAFPRTVILTRSAQDIYGPMWDADAEHGDKEPERDDGRDFPLGVVAHRSAITPITPGTRVIFHKGYQAVPVSLADHAYLSSCGAYRVDDDGKPESIEDRNARLSKASKDRSSDEQKAYLARKDAQAKAHAQANPNAGVDYSDQTKEPDKEPAEVKKEAPVTGKARFPAGQAPA